MQAGLVIPLHQQRGHTPQGLHFPTHAYQVDFFLPQYLVYVLHEGVRSHRSHKTCNFGWSLFPRLDGSNCNSKPRRSNVEKLDLRCL